MPLQMYRLAPGNGLRYQIKFVGNPTREGLGLVVVRPNEGLSVELELRLIDSDGKYVGRGRVPIDRGYLAVVDEVRRQLCASEAASEADEFELRRISEEGEPMAVQRHCFAGH